MALGTAVLLLMFIETCLGDYKCLCSYNIETPVYTLPQNSSQKIGYLYEFDCKPYISHDTTDHTIWGPIAFEKQLGYVSMDPQTTVQICPGDPSVTDALTTMAPSSSTTASTITSLIAAPSNASTSVFSTILTNATYRAISSNTKPTVSDATSATMDVLQTATNSSLDTSILQSQTTSTTPALTSMNMSMAWSKPTILSLSPSSAKGLSSTEQVSTHGRGSTTIQTHTTLLTPTATASEVTGSTTTSPSATQQLQSNRSTTTQAMTSKSTRMKTTSTPWTTTTMPITTSSQTSPKTMTNPAVSTTGRVILPNISTVKPTTQSSQNSTTILSTKGQAQMITTKAQTKTTNSFSISITKSTKKLISVTQTSIPELHNLTATTSTPMSTSTTIRSSSVTTGSTLSTVPSLTGDTSICPITQIQYAQKYNDILAQFRNKCYTIIQFSAAWEHAENICRSHGGHLLEIESKDENDFIWNLLKDKFDYAVWIGLSDIDDEGQFEWTTGDHVTYTHWLPHKHNNHGGHHVEDCVVFLPNKGLWDDIPCGYYKDDDYDETEGYTRDFICQHDIVRTAATVMVQTMPSFSASSISRPASFGVTGDISKCPQSLVNYANTFNDILAQYGNYCYMIADFQTTWEHAEDLCRAHGGHLMHISSAAENNFIYTLLDDRYHHAVWMGLHDTNTEEKFIWTSGDPVTYTHWLPNRKNNHDSHKVEDCVEFIPYRNKGAWDDLPCDRWDRPFICQNSISSSFTPTNSPAINTDPCNSNIRLATQQNGGILTSSSDSCYLLLTAKLVWAEAERNCNVYGGYLLEIDDQTEQTLIQHFLQRYDSTQAVWLGLHDQTKEGSFVWTTGNKDMHENLKRSNFGKIPLLTAELSVIERLKNLMFNDHSGFIFDRIFYIPAGQSVTYTNWMSGHQHNIVTQDIEDCGIIMPYNLGLWDDVPCGQWDAGILRSGEESHHFICEFGQKTSSITGPALVGK